MSQTDLDVVKQILETLKKYDISVDSKSTGGVLIPPNLFKLGYSDISHSEDENDSQMLVNVNLEEVKPIQAYQLTEIDLKVGSGLVCIDLVNKRFYIEKLDECDIHFDVRTAMKELNYKETKELFKE